MYQLLDFNVDYLALNSEPVFLVGTGKEAVNAYTKIFIRSIQLGRMFRLGGVFTLDIKWIGKTYCASPVWDIRKEKKPKGIYLVAENDYRKAKLFIDILNSNGIGNIIVTLPVLQFPINAMQFEHNKELYRNNIKTIQYVYERLEDEKSKIIWRKLLRARCDSEIDQKKTYQELQKLSTETGSKQYFPVGEIFDRKESERVFIDGGALNGSSAIEYARWCGNGYEKIYSFEPDNRYQGLLETNIQCHQVDRVEIVNKGLYDFTGMASFSEEPIGSSKVGKGESIVPVVKIDDFFLYKKEPVTYIKMDIEGSECKALDGAMKTIERDRPKLAICIYHGDEDIFQVPYKILKTFGYTHVYIRHYSDTVGESVVYALK